ncbi:24683_t:CDS:2 [Cetraspora pellucida]|uniref:24683_t:CDS:1 n=1 Tax=Cetraspora pellucida TaxID=1433469 RepID=A0A9N8VL98_9GLOM|nr:24683_t:CDS:2 [Cetraspora pellucida]
MFEKRLSEIPGPKQQNRRLSVTSNADTVKPESYSFFHTYVASPIQAFFHSYIVRPSKETPLIFYSVILIILSILLLFVLLITFTLYGHCVDDECTTPSLINNFDKVPSSSEIKDKSSKNQKRLDIPNIPTPSIPAPSVPDVSSSAGPAVSAVSGAVNDAANTAVNTAEDIAAKAQELLSKLLSSFDNFKPKSPTANISGFFSIPYLLAFIISIISLPFLYFRLTIIAAFLIITSSLLNAIACIFDLLLFVWVFDLISIIPGIGSQHTGPAIYLAIMSAALLSVAGIFLCIGSCCNAVRSTGKCIRNLKSSKVNDAEQGKPGKPGTPYNYF